MTESSKTPTRSNFRKFFLRGLAILLPSILTIWILTKAYSFVQENIAGPINVGVKELILFIPLPPVTKEAVDEWKAEVDPEKLKRWHEKSKDLPLGVDRPKWIQIQLRRDLRREVLYRRWAQWAFPLDLIGLIVAVVLIYSVGAFLGSFIGRRIYHRGEELLAKVPLIRQVYPSVKQVTDFLVGERKNPIGFTQVVAVEYPRKGLWSIGLVTGDPMRKIVEKVGQNCLTVFVPSSPTPFTGYVITVPKSDTIDLPITIEQALRFTVSGGVINPSSQVIGSSVATEQLGPGDEVPDGVLRQK